MQTAEKSTVAATSRVAESEPIKLLKRVGSTTYVVTVRFSEDKNAETMEEKLLRLIESEVRESA